MPSPEQLAKFRHAIDQDANGLKKIVRARSFIDYFGTIQGEKLATAPQGYNRTHPDIELLQLKQVTVVHHFSDKEVLARDFPAQAAKVCKAMKPFLDYLNGVLRQE